jgi:hypothetical protein
MGALLVLQVGFALILRERVTERLAQSARWSALNDLVNRFSMPLYLLHTTGFAAALGLAYLGLSYRPSTSATGSWWLGRPAWLALAAIVTTPIVLIGSRVLNRPHALPDEDGGERAAAGDGRG